MNMSKTYMKCGHVANATCNGKPCCIICDCFEVATEKPNLDGRMAKCAECNNTTPSKETLPFFQHRPDKEFDEYYCGCWGWD